jgi:hypothetical protein
MNLISLCSNLNHELDQPVGAATKIPRTMGVFLFCLPAEGSKIALHTKQYLTELA